MKEIAIQVNGKSTCAVIYRKWQGSTGSGREVREVARYYGMWLGSMVDGKDLWEVAGTYGGGSVWDVAGKYGSWQGIMGSG